MMTTSQNEISKRLVSEKNVLKFNNVNNSKFIPGKEVGLRK